MRRMSCNPRFVNKAGNNLIAGKIHTIRANYEYWKRFEGKDVALFTWEGKPYRSKQKIFCMRNIVSVQKVYHGGCSHLYKTKKDCKKNNEISRFHVMKNDGFKSLIEYMDWFISYPARYMAIIHFTGFKY